MIKLRNPAAATARQGIGTVGPDFLSDGRIGGVQVERDESRWWRCGLGDAMDADVDQVVAAVRSGRTEAYAEIVARYQQEVWRIAARLLADRDATGDLVQQVFVDAYFHLGQYRPGTDFGAWLRSIARNRVRREARSAARASRRLEAYRRLLLERLCDSPEADRQEQALRDALRECQEKLPGPAARCSVSAMSNAWALTTSRPGLAVPGLPSSE